jgi:hypothetical protein
MFAALLMLGAFSLTPATYAAPADATLAVEPPAQTEDGCATATQTLDVSQPAPIFMTGTCGACSLNGCAGAFIGQVCHYGQFGSLTGTCQSPYGTSCSGTSTLSCRCWSGPLP